MSRAKGNIAEDLACGYLGENGFTIVERNFNCRFGEIDIIAMKDDVLHFVEVKSGVDYESAVQNITPKKISRLIKTGDVYMKKHALDTLFTHDALIITQNNVELIKNITF